MNQARASAQLFRLCKYSISICMFSTVVTSVSKQTNFLHFLCQMFGLFERFCLQLLAMQAKVYQFMCFNKCVSLQRLVLWVTVSDGGEREALCLNESEKLRERMPNEMQTNDAYRMNANRLLPFESYDLQSLWLGRRSFQVLYK